MLDILAKLWKQKWIFRSLLKSIWFNFYYLPIKQAIRLPIVLYRPNIIKAKGNIRINGPVRTAMIQLGKPNIYLYPNDGVVFENWGGDIVFNGKCVVGNSSAISVGEKGYLDIGQNFRATCALKLACYYSIKIEDNVLLGWECLLTDSDFHTLTREDGIVTKGYGSVHIGENCWLAMKCVVLKNSIIPKNTVLSACTLYSGSKCKQEKTVISTSNEPYVKIFGLFRDADNDKIIYK